MAITNTFRNAVANENIRQIRIMMKDSILVDPTLREFKEMEHIASSIQELYDKHDGRPFINDRTQWNKDYMDKLMVQVVCNFSHERLAHLKEVVQYLYPVSAQQSSSSYNDYQNSRNHNTNRNNRDSHSSYYDDFNSRSSRQNSRKSKIEDIFGLFSSFFGRNKELSEYEKQKMQDKKLGSFKRDERL